MIAKAVSVLVQEILGAAALEKPRPGIQRPRGGQLGGQSKKIVFCRDVSAIAEHQFPVVGHVTIITAANRRHHHRDSALGSIAFNESAAQPDTMVVRRAMQQPPGFVPTVTNPVGLANLAGWLAALAKQPSFQLKAPKHRNKSLFASVPWCLAKYHRLRARDSSGKPTAAARRRGLAANSPVVAGPARACDEAPESCVRVYQAPWRRFFNGHAVNARRSG